MCSASSASCVVHMPASPNAPRFLVGKNDKQPDVADAAGAPAVQIFRADRLGGILDDLQIELTRDLHQRTHVGALAVQVNRHQRPTRPPVTRLINRPLSAMQR